MPVIALARLNGWSPITAIRADHAGDRRECGQRKARVSITSISIQLVHPITAIRRHLSDTLGDRVMSSLIGRSTHRSAPTVQREPVAFGARL
jgi:hypothetical protein